MDDEHIHMRDIDYNVTPHQAECYTQMVTVYRNLYEELRYFFSTNFENGGIQEEDEELLLSLLLTERYISRNDYDELLHMKKSISTKKRTVLGNEIAAVLAPTVLPLSYIQLAYDLRHSSLGKLNTLNHFESRVKDIITQFYKHFQPSESEMTCSCLIHSIQYNDKKVIELVLNEYKVRIVNHLAYMARLRDAIATALFKMSLITSSEANNILLDIVDARASAKTFKLLWTSETFTVFMSLLWHQSRSTMDLGKCLHKRYITEKLSTIGEEMEMSV